MKLRIKGNSVRIRLTQSEVETISAGGKVESIVNFPSGTFLKYSVVAEALEENKKLSIRFQDNEIMLSLNKNLATDWYENEIVGFSDSENLNHDEAKISLLLEKDFKCLTDRPGENEDDNYEHPLDNH